MQKLNSSKEKVGYYPVFNIVKRHPLFIFLLLFTSAESLAFNNESVADSKNLLSVPFITPAILPVCTCALAKRQLIARIAAIISLFITNVVMVYKQ